MYGKLVIYCFRVWVINICFMLCASPQKSLFFIDRFYKDRELNLKVLLVYCLNIQAIILELEVTIGYAATANLFNVWKCLYHFIYVTSPINYFSRYGYQVRCVFVLAITIRLLAPLCYMGSHGSHFCLAVITQSLIELLQRPLRISSHLAM